MKRWTEKEIEKAKEMMMSGYSYKEIGEQLNRNSNGIYNKMIALGVTKTVRNLSYKYEVDKVVGNGTLKVVKQTKTKNHRAYIVQSIKYPTAPVYRVSEYDLLNGKEDGYIHNRRIFKGNSLYAYKDIRPYLVNIEYAKTIAPHHNKPVMFRCTCGKEIKMKPSVLQIHLKNGVFPCKICSNNTSYGQIAFECYQTYNKLGFESEKILPELPNRRVDFINWDNGMWVEIQGKQHTDKNSRGHEQACEQDLEKRTFNKKNNKYNLIEIDMKISSWEYFKKQINKEIQLPNISDEDEKEILELIRLSSNLPLDKMKKMYIEEKVPLTYVAKKFGVSYNILRRMFHKNNIKLRTESYNKQSKLDKENIIQLYVKEQMSTSKIGGIYNVSRSTIRRVLKNNNVEMRCGKFVKLP